jgi:galactokinase
MFNILNYSDLVIQSPGRINLIGEHIDYNGGYVLPAAIDKRIDLYFKKNHTEVYTFYSEEIHGGFSTTLAEIAPRPTLWENFVVGVIDQFRALGYDTLEGFDCIIRSKLPIGSGVSSSAALLCGLAKGINELFSLGLSDTEMILLAQRAEHKFVGTNCGIMDQFAVIKGIKNSLIFLNCKTMDHAIVEADFDPYEIVLLNTNVSHSLAGSEYNARRKQCEAALTIINETRPGFEFLADVPKTTLLEYRETMDPVLYKRARFVVEENLRVQKAVKKIRENKLEDFGKLMYASHKGLKDLYEVSCKELDFLVTYTQSKNYVAGARMMGGGFGGCTINLVKKQHTGAFIEEISRAYSEAFSRKLTPITVAISSGAKVKSRQ